MIITEISPSYETGLFRGIIGEREYHNTITGKYKS